MATSSTTPTSSSTSSSGTSTAETAPSKLQKAGLIVELSGAASLAAGTAVAVGEHHYPVVALFVGGAIAAVVGHHLHAAK